MAPKCRRGDAGHLDMSQGSYKMYVCTGKSTGRASLGTRRASLGPSVVSGVHREVSLQIGGKDLTPRQPWGLASHVGGAEHPPSDHSPAFFFCLIGQRPLVCERRKRRDLVPRRTVLEVTGAAPLHGPPRCPPPHTLAAPVDSLIAVPTGGVLSLPF